MPDATAAALRQFEARFTKLFGPGRLICDDTIRPYDVISTGSLDLDYKTGVGGYVEGRLNELWGPEGMGKSTFSLLGIREAQRKYPHKRTAWIDMEHVFDKPWAQALGVDLKNLHIYPPDSAEDVADAMKEFLTSGLFSMVVLDSIGGMIPEAEKEKDADEEVMAKQAKIVTRMVKIGAVEAARSSTVVNLINQVRANLSYGADTTTGGGFALKHATTMKLKLKRTDDPPFVVTVAGVKHFVGHKIAIQIERLKVAPKGQTAIVSFFNQPTAKYGPIGIDRADEAASLGITLGIIEQNGAWYVFPDGAKVNGREKVVDHLREHPNAVEEIREKAIATRAHEVILTDAPLAEIEALDKAKGNAKGAKKKPNFRAAAEVASEQG
jgi:recombination protein RecA